MRSGIAAVSAPLETGRLRIQQGRCDNLLEEAQLYCYDNSQEGKGEKPLNERNHALDALRYLVNTLDARTLAGLRPRPTEPTDTPEPTTPKAKLRPWLRLDNEALWAVF